VIHRYRVGDQTVEGRFVPENVAADEGHVRPCIWMDEARAVLSNESDIADICTGEPIPIWHDGDLAWTTVAGPFRQFTWGDNDDPSPPERLGPMNAPNYLWIEWELEQGRPHPRPRSSV
jgi:hypothetical protein